MTTRVFSRAITLGVCCSVLLAGPEALADQPIKVMSFNIRYGAANDGENSWKHRHDHVITTIKKFDPDLLGTQETLKFQAEFLRSQLTGYDYFGRSREANNEDGEQTAIFFRRDRFERMEGGHFWLSENPETVGSKSWDSSLPRMASWLKLKDKVSGGELYFLNTHFDHRGATARHESAKAIRGWIKRVTGDTAVVITGDFNASENSPPYEALVTDSRMADSYRVVHEKPTGKDGTFNGWKRRFDSGRIDWVLVSPQLTATAASICHDEYDDHFPSDHFPVTAVLNWPADIAP